MRTKITILVLFTGSFLFDANISLAQGFSVSGTNTYTNPLANFVGIGIATPAYPLQINGGTDVGTLSSGNNFLVGLNYTDVTAAGVTTNSRHAVFGATTTIADILFVNKVSSTYDYYERMRINRFGRVGIGTSSPDTSALLDVSSTNKGVLIPRVALVSTTDAATITLPATSLLVYNILGGGLTPAGYWYNAGSSTSPNWVQLISTATSGSWLLAGNSISSGDFIGTTNAQDFIIKTNNTEKMRVLSGGNVGIGTAAPTSLLDVFGGELRIRMNASSAVLRFYDNIQNSSIQTNSGNIGIFTTTNERIRIQHSTGNVGIGTTSPGYKLHVVGTSRFTSDMYLDGQGYYAVGMPWIASDSIFKISIDTLHNALATIKQLKPKSYYLDTANVYGLNFSNKKQYGFIAQEIETILPELITETIKPADYDTTGNVINPALTYKSLNYGAFFGILAKGIQEQSNEIDSLKAKTNNQDSISIALQNAQQQSIDSLKTKVIAQDSTNVSLQNSLNQLMAKTNYQDSINTSLQDQLNQLLNCCNNHGNNGNHGNNLMPSGTNNSEQNDRSINLKNGIPQDGTTLTNVELSNKNMVILNQNVANPFTEETTISYYLPDNVSHAQIIFMDQSGKIIKTVDLTEKGTGQLNVLANDLSSGIYTYSLIVDGQTVETKKMVKAK